MRRAVRLSDGDAALPGAVAGRCHPLNVDWVIPCRYIEVHDNLGTLVGAGIDTFWLLELPTQIQVPMAIRLTGLPEELAPDVQHTARNIIRGPNGDTVSEVSGEFALGGGQIIERADWLQGVLVHTVIGFEVASEGTYTFEHLVDQSSASVPLHVVHGPPPGVEMPPEA